MTATIKEQAAIARMSEIDLSSMIFYAGFNHILEAALPKKQMKETKDETRTSEDVSQG